DLVPRNSRVTGPGTFVRTRAKSSTATFRTWPGSAVGAFQEAADVAPLLCAPAPTPADLWRACPPIPADERTAFAAAVAVRIVCKPRPEAVRPETEGECETTRPAR